MAVSYTHLDVYKRQVYVHPDHQGKGLGRKLLSRLIDEARDCGKHVMVAGIESQNQASLHPVSYTHLSINLQFHYHNGVFPFLTWLFS